eukprot:PITA_11877
MCLAEEEAINHLFNSCEWANHLWNWVEEILSDSNRDRRSIHNTILNWQNNFSNNQRVNNIWKTMPGFLLWTISKERNRRIFQEEHKNTDHSKETVLTNIQQLIQKKCKVDPTEKISDRDLLILKRFRLEVNHSSTSSGRQQLPNSEATQWNCPPEGSLKLNFDGTSRGNPVTAGIGGVIRNQGGKIIHIYCRELGESTNNEMEFATLKHRLRILRNLQSSKVIVEGDSSLVISVAKKIYVGTKAVRRKANGLADYLENYGMDNPDEIWDNCWHQVDCPDLKERCI